MTWWKLQGNLECNHTGPFLTRDFEAALIWPSAFALNRFRLTSYSDSVLLTQLQTLSPVTHLRTF